MFVYFCNGKTLVLNLFDLDHIRALLFGSLVDSGFDVLGLAVDIFVSVSCEDVFGYFDLGCCLIVSGKRGFFLFWEEFSGKRLVILEELKLVGAVELLL